MSQTQRISRNNTKIIQDGIWTTIRLHSTDIVSFSGDAIVLDSGGWGTSTTRTRMNQTSNQYGLGFEVRQKDYKWFVEFGGSTVPFSDRMVIRRTSVSESQR